MADPTPPSSDPPGGTTPPAPAAPAKPAVPPKPAPPAKAPAKKGQDRRFFLLTWVGAAWTAMAASLAGMTLGTVRFLFPNVLSEPPNTFKVGDPSQYEPNKVIDRYKDQGVWIVRAIDDNGRDIIFALSTVCTHLGCTPNWLERDEKFKCPCHGSGFKITGVNFEGPAPRPLERHAVRIGDDGQIVVDKSQKFQKELNQWDNPDSFIQVT